VESELTEKRMARPADFAPREGALIVAPLRNGERAHGVLALERLGSEAVFTNEEFELVKLFAAHVSIALRNAAQHRAVELRAETDRLTGLWNHGALTEHLARLAARGTRFGVLMVDLDNFKQYNDHNGHQAGNVMLQRVADRLRAACRERDLVFRFGGDEFVVLLPGTGLAGTRTVATKVNEAITAIEGGKDGIGVSCSVGVAAFPRDARDAASILLAADRACYAAKRSGRNGIATAAEGLALAKEFQPSEPTPLDPQPQFSAA
jgi:diguanylate cyclase (GGDEF)-like protein